jgi:ubiquinone/menaquinone biosynthesis C-methylase UbiE
MVDFILSFVANKQSALDIATGNGQLAKELSHHFNIVYATDISEKQLDNAEKADNIIYKKEQAEQTSFEDSIFDLVTVAQAVHWFDFDKFHNEMYRIMKPEGLIALIGYGLFATNEETDKIINYLYKDIIGPYWDPERKYIDDNYTTLPFPYKEIPAKHFKSELTWSFEQLAGYLETWSAVQHYKDKKGENPLDIVRKDLRSSWEKSDQKITFPFLLRLGKLNKQHS